MSKRYHGPTLFGLLDKPPSVPVPTSEAAAEAIAPKADTLRRAVLEHIQKCGEDGATDEEIQDALSMSGDTERPRRWECQRAGLIRDSGRTRAVKSGRAAVVWVATGLRAS